MPHETYLAAVEKALADLVVGFGEMPDLYLHEGDLYGDLYHRLVSREALRQSLVTRDGRRTTLVHLVYPALLAAKLRARQERYPLVVLNPAFVRNWELAVVSQTEPARLEALCALPEEERIPPLVCAMDVHLFDQFSDERMEALKEGMACLAEAGPDAPRRYLVILSRNWQRDGQRHRLLETLGDWARTHPQVAIVYVQSYLDDVGRVYGGRYLNRWDYMAPLVPLALVPRGPRQHGSQGRYGYPSS